MRVSAKGWGGVGWGALVCSLVPSFFPAPLFLSLSLAPLPLLILVFLDIFPPSRLSQAIIPAMNVPLVEWEADGGARFATFLEGLGADARRAFKDRIQAIIRASRIHTTS